MFPSRLEAELAKSYLESYEINSFIQADDAGGMYPAPLAPSPGVNLSVNEIDYERAVKLLDSIK